MLRSSRQLSDNSSMLTGRCQNPGLRLIAAALLFLGVAVAAPACAQEMSLRLDPASSQVSFTLNSTLHTVHGTFQLRSGDVRFNPASGEASGLVVVDVTSGESGNKSRDRKMHKDVLESDKYPEATFTPTHISGNISPEGMSTFQVLGVFRLHGTDHPIALTVPAQIKGSSFSTSVHMVIPYIAWGLKNPSNFLLHVSDTVSLEITAVGQLNLAVAAGAH
jgi:polyisoprenoid-binding protein YceI